MKITHKWISRLPAASVQLLSGIAGLALITFVCFQFDFGVARTGFFYVILVALVSVLGSFGVSIALSLAAAGCLNFFFAPPLFEFRIDAADDVVRIAAFLTTSLVVAGLTTKARASEIRFRTFVDQTTDGLFVFDEHQAIRDVNRLACESLGYSREELIGMRARDFDAGLDETALARIADRVRSGETVTFESVHRRKDGTTFPVEVRARQFQQGAHRFRMSVARNITERRRAEEVLRESEARFQRAQRIAHFGWWERDFSTNRVSLSDEACRIFGVQPLELPQWHGRWLGLIHPEDRPRAAAAAAAALVRGGPRYDVEYRVVRPDGSERAVRSQGEVVWDEAGRPLRQFGVMQDITELRNAEQELRVSEARFRTFVDYATDAFFLLDDQSTIVDANREACETLGYSREELIGRHRSEIDIGLEDGSIQRIRERITGGDTVTFETRHRRKDGTSFPVEIRAGQFEQNGRRFLCLARDITERKRAEQELRASEARFRTFVDHATDAFFLLDDHWIILDVNREACASLGFSREELIGRHRTDFDVGLDAASLAPLRQRIAAGETVTFETRHTRRDGTSFPVEVREGQLDPGGRRFLCLARDVTERKRAEDELRESEERFRTLVQFSFDVYWETDAEHRFTRQEFAGGLDDAPTPGSELGKTRWEVSHLEPDAEGWRKHRETLDAHLPFRDFELARPTADGGKRYVSVSGLPVFDKTGHFIGYRGVGRHITERKRVEEALRRSESYLAEAQRLSHTGTMVLDPRGAVYLSEESYRIWGLDPLQGLPSRETLLQRVHPDDRQRVDSETKGALAERKDYVVEFRIIGPGGTVRHLEATGHPLLSSDGRIEILGTQVDVTERKRAEEEHQRLRQLEADLAHVNRLSIMGELAASLAHEILHPIATARNNARAGMRYLELHPPNLDKVRELLTRVVRDADRAKGIVDRMRDHIKKAAPANEPIDINEAITEVMGMVQGAIDKHDVAVRTRLAEGLIPIRGDRVQLQQVVVNLVLNAVEAMSTGENGARELTISTHQCATGGVEVVVSDSGPGIDPEHLQRVFEPFYTTKSSGIGMGLSICRSIIDGHGGRLWAEPNEPRGTIFRFTLPPTQDSHECA